MPAAPAGYVGYGLNRPASEDRRYSQNQVHFLVLSKMANKGNFCCGPTGLPGGAAPAADCACATSEERPSSGTLLVLASARDLKGLRSSSVDGEGVELICN